MSINFGGIGEVAEGLTSTDPTLGTCSPSEAAIRNSLPFTDIRIGFPTLSGAAAGSNWAKQGLQRGLDSITATNSITFPAYIKQFKDDFKPQWGGVPVFGRPDKIPIYERTERSITLSLLIPCYDKSDANENLKKLNTFTKNLYPSYNKIGNKSDNWYTRAFGQEDDSRPEIMSSPPLIRIKFANLVLNHADSVSGLLGYVTSFSSDMQIASRGVFLRRAATTAGAILPRAIELNFTFTVLHERTPGFDASTKRFIGEGAIMGGDYPYRTISSFGGANPPVANWDLGGVDKDVADKAVLGHSDQG